jgi:hypothetical protein
LARELIGRLSMARMLFISDPPLVLKMNSIALVAVWSDHSTARSVAPREGHARIDTINHNPANSMSTRIVLRNVSSLIFQKSLKPVQRPATMNGTPTPSSVSVSLVKLPAAAWVIEITTSAINSTG